MGFNWVFKGLSVDETELSDDETEMGSVAGKTVHDIKWQIKMLGVSK